MASTFEIPVIKVKLDPHNNADSLSIVRYMGYQIIVRSDEWKDGDLAAYVRPDSVVPVKPEWEFLEGKRRIRTRRFRGEWSHGLIVKSPLGAVEGDNVAKEMEIINYEPPSKNREGGGSTQGNKSWWTKLKEYLKELGVRPRGKYPHYDIEHLRRYIDLIQEDEEVIITEKIHGACSTYLWKTSFFGTSKMYMRSRKLWKWPGTHWWSKAYNNTPQLESFIKSHPQYTVYGEVFGSVQKLSYGKKSPHFVAFDLWENETRTWMPQDRAHTLLESYDVPKVPILYTGPYKGLEHVTEVSNQDSVLASRFGVKKQLSEGCVVSSLKRRVILKVVSDRYMAKVEIEEE